MVGAAQGVAERGRVEAARRAGGEPFRSIAETTTEWIWESDRAGHLTYSNPAIAAILGYRPEELLGQDALAYLHEVDRRQVAALLPRLAAARQGWSGLVLRWRHRDGSYRYLESNGAPVLDGDGELIGYRGADRRARCVQTS